MGTICVDMFITLDGVYQGPGGPDEDRSGGFDLGGWQGAYMDEESGRAISAGIDGMDALLLGRRTYDIFAGYWPALGDSNPIAAKFNALPKFVVSHLPAAPAWKGTTALTSMDGVAGLKGQFENIHVVGSGVLARALLDAGLADRLTLFMYPLTLGRGRRLFDGETGVPAAFSLAQPPKAFPKGCVSLVYDRTGAPVTGIDMGRMG